jgi:CRISPR type I-E-associated protein CasB/Cse2
MSAELPVPAAPERPLHLQLRALAQLVHGLTRTGDVAELRRGRPDGVPGFAFWRVLAQAELAPSDEALPAFIVAAGLMAMAHGRHAPGVRLGAALAAAGVDERRVLALLRAEAPGLYDQARAIVHLLDTSGHSFDHAELAMLVVGTHPELAERARRRVAADFFRSPAAAAAASPSTSAPTTA